MPRRSSSLLGVESGGQSLPAGLRVALSEYLGALRAESGLAANTLAAYRRDLEGAAARLHAAGVEDWETVQPEDLAQLLADRRAEGLAPASQMRLLSALRGFYRFLLAERRGPERDPTRLAGKVHLWRRLPEVLAPEECRALLDAPPAEGWKGLRDRALLALLYGGGLEDQIKSADPWQAEEKVGGIAYTLKVGGGVSGG